MLSDEERFKFEMKQSEKRQIANFSLWTGAIALLGTGAVLLLSDEIGWGFLSLAGGVATLVAIWLGRIRDNAN